MSAVRRVEFRCPNCLGEGRVDGSGNNPQPYYVTCEVCDGHCDLTAQEMLDHCMSELRVARKALRMVKAPYLVANFKEVCQHWLTLAKQARAKVLESEHAGSAHIGRAAA